MKTKTIPTMLHELYSRLDLFYKHYAEQHSLVADNTGEIDFSAFLDASDGKFWIDSESGVDERKKVLVFNSGYFRYLNSHTQSIIASFFEELKQYGFEVYIPCERSQPVASSSRESSIPVPLTLKKLQKGALDLINLTPVPSPTAIELAAGINIPKDRIKLVNNQFLGVLLQTLVIFHQIKVFDTSSWLPLYPEGALSDQEALIAMLEPEDGFAIDRDDWSIEQAYQLQPALVDRVKLMVATHDLDKFKPIFPQALFKVGANEQTISDDHLVLPIHGLNSFQKTFPRETSDVLSLNVFLNGNDIDDWTPLLKEIRQYVNLNRVILSCHHMTLAMLACVLRAMPGITDLKLTCVSVKRSEGDAGFPLEPGSLPHLTTLNIPLTKCLEGDGIDVLLQAAPNLSFCTTADFFYGKTPGLQLSSLINLTCYKIKSFETIDTALAVTPNLHSLSILTDHRIDASAHIRLIPILRHLKYLCLGIMVPDQLAIQLIQSAPFLTGLSVPGSQQLSRHPFHLNNLRYLEINGGIHPQSLIFWFQKAPNLQSTDAQSIEISDEVIQQQRGKYQTLQRAVRGVSATSFTCITPDTDLSWLVPDAFAISRSLYVRESSLTAQQVQAILGVFPSAITVHFLNVMVDSQATTLRQHALTALHRFSWCNDNKDALPLEPRLIQALLQVAPGIKHMHIQSCEPYLDLVTALKQTYSDMELTHKVNKKTYQPATSSSSLKPDGQLRRIGHEMHSTTSLFINHQQFSPPTFSYHLRCYIWSGSHDCFIPYVPDPCNMESLKTSSSRSPSSFANTWLRDSAQQSPDHFLGQYNGTLLPGQLRLLPALSNGDKVKDYACDFPDVTLWRDRLSGYHFIQSETVHLAAMLAFGIRKGEVVSQEPSSAPLPDETLMLFSQLMFENGKLQPNRAYQQLKEWSVQQLVPALSEFCRFPDYDDDDFRDDNTSALFNHLLRTRAGSCRHRGWLFAALASEFGLLALYDDNDCHGFCVVITEGGPTVIDLGGAPAKVHTRPFVMPNPVKTCQPAQSEPVSKIAPSLPVVASSTPHYIIPAEWDDYFTIWNNCPLSATTPEDLAYAMVYQYQDILRHLLILPDSTAIESLSQTVLTLVDAPVFFTPHLDDLQLIGNRVADDGAFVPADSALGLFIKQAQAQPDTTFVWFINFSDNKPEHIIYNQLFENEGRHLGSLALPDNLRLVMVLDKFHALQLAEDMLSRMDKTSTPEQVTWSAATKPDWPKRPVEPGDVLVINGDGWKSDIIGNVAYEDGHFFWNPGPLYRLQNHQVLTLHNVPWHTRSFRQFFYTLQGQGQFFANAQWHKLAHGASVQLAEPVFEIAPVLPVTAPIAQAFPLNKRTWRVLLPYKGIDAHSGFIINHPGLLAQMPLRLIATEAVDAAVGYALSQQAGALSCPLQVQALPGVVLPETLRAFQLPEQPLTPCEHIQITICPDLDFALDGLLGHSVAIDETTRFESLFSRVKREGMRLLNQETDLARAIRHGEPVILHGQFSPEFIRRAQTLFVNPPHLFINGERIMVEGPVTLVSNDKNRFAHINHQTLDYHPDMDYQRLPESERSVRKALYQTLEREPCHAHFRYVPNTTQGLRLSAGQPIETPPLTPEAILAAFETQPCQFLIGQSGTGKSELFLRGLPAWAKEKGIDLKVHQGKATLLDWIHQETGIAIWFDDEANCKNQDYTFLYNLLRGEFVIWLNGMRYPLDPLRHKVGLAGNFLHFEGRVEADLFRRFLPYQEAGSSLHVLDTLLRPLVARFSDPESQRALIRTCYVRALNSGLVITPRNAMMICIQAYTLRLEPCLHAFSDDMLIRYAISLELRGLYKKSPESNYLLRELKRVSQAVDERLQAQPVPDLGEDFTWTPVHRKIAETLYRLTRIRERKAAGDFKQHEGINGLLLEGPPGVFKTQLLRRLLTAWNVPFVVIDTSNRKTRNQQMIDAWHSGLFILIDELNGLDDEYLLNTLLSGTDPDGNPPNQPGAFFAATQNPVSTSNRLPLSDALANRLTVVVLEPYRAGHLRDIAQGTHKLPDKTAYWLTQRYQDKQTQAIYSGLLRPTDRLFFKAAADIRQRHGTQLSELEASLPPIPESAVQADNHPPAVDEGSAWSGYGMCHML